MRTILLPSVVALFLIHSHRSGAAAAQSEGQSMMNAFLKQEAIRLDSTFLEGVTNRTQWEAQRKELRRQYLEMLGLWPLPERTPLEAKTTGVIDREEGFRVEKVHFQSRPKLYVTGNLYLPRAARSGARLPAVLYVCGHSGRGRDGNKAAFQHHGMWFATHGYVCLIIDTLQLGEIAAIHHGTYRYNRWWWQARGYTPAGVECWNGVRALDYLQNRPEVDPDRLAVTGISGGGAATFWIAAADDRVKVAVPVSGMGDLEDYVGEKVVNGHCDCMFLINTFQWPWTQIAALIPPRPMLFENSGHDTIFPMNGNDRIRARLERLYGFYTNRTDRLFDIGVTPGGHDDKVELRLMAYRWINRFLKNEDTVVTEPDLPKIDGKMLRVFLDDLPSDQINTTIDETFVAPAKSTTRSTTQFQSWRTEKLEELKRIVFRSLPAKPARPETLRFSRNDPQTGTIASEPDIRISWKHFPGKQSNERPWLVVLNENESLDTKPEWLSKIAGNRSILLLAPRGRGPLSREDPPPYCIQRSLPLLGRTVDSCRVIDVLSTLQRLPRASSRATWGIAGFDKAGLIAAYAAILDGGVQEVVLVEPPATHRNGPIFLNILRVVDVPEALGMLAPLPQTIYASDPSAFEPTKAIYHAASGTLNLRSLP